MATSSIFKSIKPNDKVGIRKLVRALERSKESKAQEVQMSRAVSEFTAEQLKKAFGEKDDGLQDRKP